MIRALGQFQYENLISRFKRRVHISASNAAIVTAS